MRTLQPLGPVRLLSKELSRQEYWIGYTFLSPGDLPNPGTEPGSSALQADSLPAEPPGKPANAGDMGSIPSLGRSHMPWSN